MVTASGSEISGWMSMMGELAVALTVALRAAAASALYLHFSE